jgi:hypothetical protein
MDNPFGTGAPPPSGGLFEPAMLPRGQKEQLCRELLGEFGITHVTVGGYARDELIHACLISDYHTDQRRNPTASLNFEKLTYNCLGCGSSGGLLWFIAVIRKCRSEQAYQWLANKTGTGGFVQDIQEFMDYLDAIYSGKAKPPPIPRYSSRLLEPWAAIHPYLTDGAQDVGLPGRHLDENVIRRFKLGWDPEADRIVLPHFWKGALVGWQTRRIWNDGTPKYLSSPDFPKDRTIFNADDPLVLAGDRPVIVVESMMTVYTHCQQWPIVATFGAEVTEAQLRILQGFKEIVTFFDNDRAGWKATNLVRDQLDGRGPMIYSVENPFTKHTDGGDLSTRWFAKLVSDPVDCAFWEPPEESTLIEYEEAA